MKVHVDSERCHGHARCLTFAPETFEFDNEGFAHVREGFEDVSAENEAGVQDACANCPEHAIVLTED